MEPPNKDSFVLSLSFCIEAYGMNLDGTVAILKNLVFEAEHEEFLGKAATSNEVGKMRIRVYTKGCYILANLSAAPTRSDSRPSTPTRRNPAPSSSTTSSASTSAGRVLSNGHIPGPSSRPSCPSPRVRPPPQPVIPPDFTLDTPPNHKTTLQETPLTAGRSRTGVSSAMKGNPETMGSVNASRRHSSPIVTRGRLTEPSGKGRAHSNGLVADTP
ncbi:hypothetical protein SADUNF_Sadunf06G0088000 [Salix dunnii]|uniref:Uncharacterized protein n=1 Tax=Salix dunnii TaxID=1413687 RepID=A0A835N2V7_9ROSI|nr:hypothetical protein SADUNF_Sadunf06G0088000 [Salix dunnii]